MTLLAGPPKLGKLGSRRPNHRNTHLALPVDGVSTRILQAVRTGARLAALRREGQRLAARVVECRDLAACSGVRLRTLRKMVLVPYLPGGDQSVPEVRRPE
jgi:hypothetical protein